MTTFDEVLSRIEAIEEARCAPRSLCVPISAPMLDPSPPASGSALRAVRAAYLRTRDDVKTKPPEAYGETLARELRAAAGDVDSLRRLRRRLAWLLHPDRQVDVAQCGEISLARINAEIDDALRRLETSVAQARPRS